ncbi:mediator of RNA polymerase II transcription subunit 8-like [Tigriopus californicus]|uniref:mediator of RNA polymerase II transcription subunit 8-like n=1 Tax=Tigriopus californicus TaxID=6832 RepID=UPI0027DA2F83|nr:mediator of RNA polymerase II transcription subunit 8-like [Tigriopus californicus]|eukprot:TCALIF_03950-PA protein Name:"Similar to MED8 Mediator of RNA polymerase II transcription subunit 8 (Anopheles gambiae)" AED:0.02 eAED:0.02 QI:0/-1/0/1/-1/1/1/0/276
MAHPHNLGGLVPPTGAPATAGHASVEREQKLLDDATASLATRLQELKGSIAGLIGKLENDPHLNWPSFLDSYGVITGQLNSLLKHIKNPERTPNLKKYICLPLLLSPERDEAMLRLTEGRVATFSHDLVPHYLRTNPDPDVQSKHQGYESRASSLSQDTATKQLSVMEKIMRETGKTINREKDDMDSRASNRAEIEKTCTIEDTYGLVATVSLGKGLKSVMVPTMSGHAGGLASGSGGSGRAPPPGSSLAGPMAKVPSLIKTNIKAATQVHPYSRP